MTTITTATTATSHAQSTLHDLLETSLLNPLPTNLITQALTNPPFITVPGISNLRDISAALASPPLIQSNLIYRSGALINLPPTSISKLKTELQIKMILDLRSTREIEHSPNPVIEGVTNLRVESLRAGTPIRLANFVEDDGKKAYVAMYEEILEIYGGSVRAVLEWIGERRGAVLVHCSAGKDRTGVLVAVLLALAGVSEDDIAYDYTLSRIGIEPVRNELSQMMKSLCRDWSAETPGMRELAQVRKKYILGMFEMMEGKYGGVEGYVRGLGFGESDLVRIRSVLRGTG